MKVSETISKIAEIVDNIWDYHDDEMDRQALSEIQCIIKKYYQDTTSNNLAKNPEVISDYNDINL